MTGAELIAQERKRQIEQEGWSAAHDALHGQGNLALAGACYAIDAVANTENHRNATKSLQDIAVILWPWSEEWWKPTHKDYVRQLVKAGALIAAEIDRLQRPIRC